MAVEAQQWAECAELEPPYDQLLKLCVLRIAAEVAPNVGRPKRRPAHHDALQGLDLQRQLSERGLNVAERAASGQFRRCACAARAQQAGGAGQGQLHGECLEAQNLGASIGVEPQLLAILQFKANALAVRHATHFGHTGSGDFFSALLCNPADEDAGKLLPRRVGFVSRDRQVR